MKVRPGAPAIIATALPTGILIAMVMSYPRLAWIWIPILAVLVFAQVKIHQARRRNFAKAIRHNFPEL